MIAVDLDVPAEILVVVEAVDAYFLVPLAALEVLFYLFLQGLVDLHLVLLVKRKTHLFQVVLVAGLHQDIKNSQQEPNCEVHFL